MSDEKNVIVTPVGNEREFGSWAKSNPLPVIGAVGTLGALTYGFRNMLTGDKMKSSYAMQGRVYAQFFAVAAMGAGAFWASRHPSSEDDE